MRIIQHVAFGIWLLSLSRVLLRFEPCGCMYQEAFLPSSCWAAVQCIEGHLGCFQCGTIMNRAAVEDSYAVFVRTCFPFFWVERYKWDRWTPPVTQKLLLALVDTWYYLVIFLALLLCVSSFLRARIGMHYLKAGLSDCSREPLSWGSCLQDPLGTGALCSTKWVSALVRELAA